MNGITYILEDVPQPSVGAVVKVDSSTLVHLGVPLNLEDRQIQKVYSMDTHQKRATTRASKCLGLFNPFMPGDLLDKCRLDL